MSTASAQDIVEFGAAGFGITPFSAIVPNNTTGVVVKPGPGMLFALHGDNNSTNSAYMKFYDKATAPLSSDTPVLRYQIHSQASGPLDVFPSGGFTFYNGISYRVTAGQADNDTGSPAATTYVVTLGYK